MVNLGEAGTEIIELLVKCLYAVENFQINTEKRQ